MEGEKQSSKLDEPVIAQQPSEKTSQEEAPIENPHSEPGQEREEGAPVVQEPELESKSEEMGLEKTAGEYGDV